MNHSTEQEDRYVTSLKIHYKNSNTRQTMMNYAQDVTVHTMNNIAKDRLASSMFRVLGVGSGHGQVDLRILNAIATAIESSQKKRPVIHTTIIEPSALIQEFRSSVSPLPQPLGGLADVSFEWHQTTFQKFIESFPGKECFEVVHFIASLYYMDAETSLKICHQLLASGGAMFCTLAAERSFFPKLAKKLDPGRVDFCSAHKLFTEVDVINIAQKNNWKYEELRSTRSTNDISSCFDESSTEGGLLLDFLTHQENFRVTADRKLYEDVMEFLNEECTTDESGKKFITPEMTAIVIYK